MIVLRTATRHGTAPALQAPHSPTLMYTLPNHAAASQATPQQKKEGAWIVGIGFGVFIVANMRLVLNILVSILEELPVVGDGLFFPVRSKGRWLAAPQMDARNL